MSCPNTFLLMALGGRWECLRVSSLKEGEPREGEGPLKLPWPVPVLASAPAPHTASPGLPA